MKIFTKIFLLLLVGIILSTFVWFYLGPFLRGSQSDLLFFIGTFVNVLVFIPIVYIGSIIYKLIKEFLWTKKFLG